MKLFEKRKYFVRRMSTGGGSAVLRNFSYTIRRILITGTTVVILLFCAGLLIKYFFQTREFRINISMPSFFAVPKYFIIKDNFYIIYSNGTTKFVDNNVDKSDLPVLSGASLTENNEQKRKAINQALKIDKKYLTDISEININNPDRIFLITIDGKKIIAGDRITGEMLENYMLAAEKFRKLHRKFSTVDIRFKDKIIIR
jgi:hypothetical protein